MIRSHNPKSDTPYNSFIRRIELALIRLMMKLTVRIEMTGFDNIPSSGPMLLIINHVDFLDPVFVLSLLPRLVTPMAKIETFRSWIWGWFVKSYGTIPVRRDDSDLPAFKQALRILKQEGAVLVAPEGTRSPTGQLQPAKDGAALLALRSDAQIVPIGIAGTEQVKRCWLHLKRPVLRFSAGEPFQICRVDQVKRVSRDQLAAITEQMMYRLAGQLPAEYRGVYQDLEAASDHYLVSAKNGV